MHATPKRNKATLPRGLVLRHRTEFDRVKLEGKRVRGRWLSLNWAPRPDQLRLTAFIVPKACGSAVERNKLRRRLREHYRLLQHELLAGQSLIWITHRVAGTASFPELRTEMRSLLTRATLWISPSPA